MYDYIPLSVSLHTMQNLVWIFAGAMHAKVKSVFSKHMQVNGFLFHYHDSRVSLTLIPARLYKMIDKAGEKNYSYQPAAGKILEK